MQIDFANDDIICEKNENFDRNITQFQLILIVFDFEHRDRRKNSQKYIDVFVQLLR